MQIVWTTQGQFDFVGVAEGQGEFVGQGSPRGPSLRGALGYRPADGGRLSPNSDRGACPEYAGMVADNAEIRHLNGGGLVN